MQAGSGRSFRSLIKNAEHGAQPRHYLPGSGAAIALDALQRLLDGVPERWRDADLAAGFQKLLAGRRLRPMCGLHRLAQIRTFAISQRDEFSLCTSKFESDMLSHGVGLRDVSRHMHVDRERDEQAAATSSGGDLHAAS
jgi:hypothetical protein